MLNDEIRRILDDKNPEKKLEEVKKAVEIVTGIQNGEYVYCKKCNDYFLAGSFIRKQEIIKEKVCVYSDPINSSGDEYKIKPIRYTYSFCPKGCKHIESREEYWV